MAPIGRPTRLTQINTNTSQQTLIPLHLHERLNQAIINVGVTAALAAVMRPEMAMIAIHRNQEAYSQRFQKWTNVHRMFPERNRRKLMKSRWLAPTRSRQVEQPESSNQTTDQNTGSTIRAGNGDRKPYGGPKPLCSKCNYHHEGPCAPKCSKCNRFGHLGRDCRSPPNVNTGANQRACFECGAQGHFKKDCPKLKNNNNRGNQAGNAKAQAKVSFVSTAFSSRIVITPTALDHDYNVELADGRIVGLNTIMGCTLNFLNHPFNIDLMPVELGSFDVIIGMDWLAKYHAVIVCAEKIVRIPFGDEILIVRGDESSNKQRTRLTSSRVLRPQEYLTSDVTFSLRNITATKDEDKSKEKRLEDVPVV
ncbi:putative reverse transcriptase domain-containing protein [Tanacetum coccineum]